MSRQVLTTPPGAVYLISSSVASPAAKDKPAQLVDWNCDPDKALAEWCAASLRCPQSSPPCRPASLTLSTILSHLSPPGDANPKR